jgi:hypothetical protein
VSLYLNEHERSALASIDRDGLRKLIDEAVCSCRSSALHELRLASCGAHVTGRLRRFERDLDSYIKAKSAQKRSDTRQRANDAGADLVRAVGEMQARMVEEDKELERFRIDDLITPPSLLRERIEVRVSFQWRDAAADGWRLGSITFSQQVDLSPDYTRPQPKRKPSAREQAEAQQDELYRHWEHLRMLAIHSVREYLQKGGNGAAIPRLFETRASAHSRYLNNFSCDFWRDEATSPSATG